MLLNQLWFLRREARGDVVFGLILTISCFVAPLVVGDISVQLVMGLVMGVMAGLSICGVMGGLRMFRYTVMVEEMSSKEASAMRFKGGDDH